MKTPYEKLGYKVGDKFTVNEDKCGFKKGQVVTLHGNVGMSCPLFSGDNTEYLNAGGKPGAYLELTVVTPYVEPKHKHADLIKAWADGAEVQYQKCDGTWGRARTPAWELDYKFRIKPKTKLVEETMWAKFIHDLRGNPFLVGYIWVKTGEIPCSPGFAKVPDMIRQVEVNV